MSRISILIVGVFFLFAYCKQQKSFIYPEYSTERNTLKEYPHLDDSTLSVKKVAIDPQYGRDPLKPIFVGVYDYKEGGKNREKFFNALTGPNGEQLLARRYKSCCPFKTKNSYTIGADQKFGLLDIWLISIEGNPTDTLYVNPYDQGELIAPVGYKLRSDAE